MLNAGAGASAPLDRTTDAEWQRMLDLNLTAPFRMLRRAVPGHGRAGGSAGSWPSRRSRPSAASPTSPPTRRASTALLGLVRSAAAELAAHRRDGQRRVPRLRRHADDRRDASPRSAPPPGAPRRRRAQALERRQPIGRLVTADEVADAVLLCVANAAITGQGINVDGGAVQD